MATWLVHLRIAEALLESYPFNADYFYIGNIAPDCGLPQGDGSYAPSSEVTHWTKDGDHKSTCDYTRFRQEYIDNESDFAMLSYMWGYYCHLLTDVLWSDLINAPTKEKFRELYDSDKDEFYRLVKRDWRNNDFLFLRENRGYRPLRRLNHPELMARAEKVGGALPYYTAHNLTDKLGFIPKFYSNLNRKLDWDYPYLNRERYEEFVKDAVRIISEDLSQQNISFM